MEHIIDKPNNKKSDLTLLFAHGAGAPMDSDFMTVMSQRIANLGITVVRFEFPYMQQRRSSGKKRPPDRAPKLLEAFLAQVEHFGGSERCVVAGKSMGGRMASMLLANGKAAAAVSLGYPFHPPANVDAVRSEHWVDIQRPWLIVQGTRDPFGKQHEVMEYPLPASSQLHWLQDGDHDFKPRKSSGLNVQDHYDQAAHWVVDFILELGA